MEQNDIMKSIWKKSRVFILLASVLVVAFIALLQVIFKLTPGDSFTLGQLLVEIILLPIAITSFVFAIVEFRVNSRIPKICLYWERQADDYAEDIELGIPQGTNSIPELRLALKNVGESVTTWYLVQFEIPDELGFNNNPQLVPMLGGSTTPSPAESSNSHWGQQEIKDGRRRYFMSNGKFALYPN